MKWSEELERGKFTAWRSVGGKRNANSGAPVGSISGRGGHLYLNIAVKSIQERRRDHWSELVVDACSVTSVMFDSL